MTAPRALELCWRCRTNRVRVYGVPCPSCLAILHAEYDAKVVANGGQLLYLGGKPIDVRSLVSLKPAEPAKPPLLCQRCFRSIPRRRTRGRNPKFCERCRTPSELRQLERMKKFSQARRDAETTTSMKTLIVLDEDGSCSVPCGGRCCEDFTLNFSPEEIGQQYLGAVARIRAGEDRPFDWEAVCIAEMVIRIDEPDECEARYTCANLDRSSGLCTIYEKRPRLCRDFPDYGVGKACHLCGAQAQRPDGECVVKQ